MSLALVPRSWVPGTYYFDFNPFNYFIILICKLNTFSFKILSYFIASVTFKYIVKTTL
jgi:hypothetical protein